MQLLQIAGNEELTMLLRQILGLPGRLLGTGWESYQIPLELSMAFPFSGIHNIETYLDDMATLRQLIRGVT